MMERKFRASWGFAIAEGRKILFAKPLTFMNRSGEAVGEIIKYFGIASDRMLVIHDDLDLPLARVRIAQRGGSGGHKGIQSIIDHVGASDFPRLKMGIGRPETRRTRRNLCPPAPIPRRPAKLQNNDDAGRKSSPRRPRHMPVRCDE